MQNLLRLGTGARRSRAPPALGEGHELRKSSTKPLDIHLTTAYLISEEASVATAYTHTSSCHRISPFWLQVSPRLLARELAMRHDQPSLMCHVA
jgi:hypothetical protein